MNEIDFTILRNKKFGEIDFTILRNKKFGEIGIWLTEITRM